MSNSFSTLLQLPPHDYSWMAQFLSLLVLPFAHEDLAIILGAYVVVNKIMPAGFVALCIYAGMVTSDLAMYGIGAGARRLPWLGRLAVNDRVRSAAESLNRNLFGLMALCRLVPGVAFIALIACGWMRVPFGRFATASFLVSALYLPLILYLLIVFGDAMDDHVGWWAWPLLVVALAGMDFLRRRVFSFQPQARIAVLSAGASQESQGRRLPVLERIPPILFYIPLILSWLRFAWRYRSLTLPTIVNPYIPGRGRAGESLSDYLADVAVTERNWMADFVVLRRAASSQTSHTDLERAQQLLIEAGLTFPVVARPDLRGSGHRVCRIDDPQSLLEYLRTSPGGVKIVLQRFVPYACEAVVRYARLPGLESGRILSLTFRDRPHTLGGQRAAGISRDARHYITPALEARFDAIARSMSEFHYGRFDLRFASPENLALGENFTVTGISGVGGEAIEVSDPRLPVAEVYRRFVDRQRIVFLIGERNRARGFRPMGCTDLFKSLVRRAAPAGRSPASA